MTKKHFCCGVLIAAALFSNALFAQNQQAQSTNNLSVYRVTETKINDLVHTKLDVSFDYAKP